MVNQTIQYVQIFLQNEYNMEQKINKTYVKFRKFFFSLTYVPRGKQSP